MPTQRSAKALWLDAWTAVSAISAPDEWNRDRQDGELVAQHQNLQVLGSVTANEQSEQLGAAREVAKFGEHQVASVIGRWGNSITAPSRSMVRTRSSQRYWNSMARAVSSSAMEEPGCASACRSWCTCRSAGRPGRDCASRGRCYGARSR
jgi:hypothetical protein